MGPWSSLAMRKFQVIVHALQVTNIPNVLAVAKSLSSLVAVQQQLVNHNKCKMLEPIVHLLFHPHLYKF